MSNSVISIDTSKSIEALGIAIHDIIAVAAESGLDGGRVVNVVAQLCEAANIKHVAITGNTLSQKVVECDH